MKFREKHIITVMMNYALNDRHHELIAPNNTLVFTWEADLLSVTRAGLIHEYEVKLNKSDFKADAKKVRKHQDLEFGWGPAYFWYVTFEFDIEPPKHAGWILVSRVGENKDIWNVTVKVEAPRISTGHITDVQRSKIARSLSYIVRYGYSQDLKREIRNG